MRAYANKPDAGSQYVGVIPYVGTPGRGKNATKATLDAYVSNGVLVAYFHETTAGWMLGGRAAGVAAARAALNDLTAMGRTDFRCVYFACDIDVTSASQMVAVEQCCAGAASVLGKARTGVYGEADVIDAVVGGGFVTYGCQTRAWSGGRVSGRAHLLQLVGYVYPGDKQCDRSLILKADWGQSGKGLKVESMPEPQELWNFSIPYPTYAKDVPHAKNAYTAGEYLAGQSVALGRALQRLDALAASNAALTKALATFVADSRDDLNADELKAFLSETLTAGIREGLKTSTVNVHVDVTGGDNDSPGTSGEGNAE
jgi:hypothetical protein